MKLVPHRNCIEIQLCNFCITMSEDTVNQVRRVVKGIFVSREFPIFFLVKWRILVS